MKGNWMMLVVAEKQWFFHQVNMPPFYNSWMVCKKLIRKNESR